MKQLTKLTLLMYGLFICGSIGLAQNKSSTISDRSKLKPRAIKTIYDKSKDETSVVLMPMTVRETPGTIEAIFPADGANRKLPSARLEMVAYFSFPGKTLITPDHVILAFRSLSQDEVKFASDRQLIVIADGSRLNLGEMLVTDRRVDSGIQMRETTFYRETLELPVPYESFVNIANATKVNMRVGKTEFELTADQRESLRTLAKRIQN